ncbi:MAG TPA: sulfatase-like hydrolase/transferase [Polyangiaceae bacterium]|jgi:glucan phosphoethanolaminetransferase (alkaline phosphatase superfamily)|nr:sulfatase-like hydrolase/transferase [Polyangiaceae bacterium]
MQTATENRPDAGAEPGESSRRARLVTLHKLVGYRKAAAVALLTVPTVMVLIVDLARRGPRIVGFTGFYRETYLAAIVESLVVWATLLYAASRRRGVWSTVVGVLFVIALTLSLGGQRYFHDQYKAYLNVDVSLFATNLMDSVFNQLLADIGNYLIATTPPLTVSVVALVLARRIVRPRRRRAFVAGLLAPLVLIGSFFVPTQHRHMQAATPDVLYLEAIGGIIRTQLGFTDQSRQLRPRQRNSLPVVLANPPAKGKRPNVLFIILESTRADAVCVEPEADCKRTPYSDRVVPERYPFSQMRSLDSSTAISLAVLWSGVGPDEPREVLHTWPLLFDYARAEGYDTAFYTSQNMMFGNARLWVKNLGVSQIVTATDLDPTCDLDMGAPEALLAKHVNAHIGELKEPFLAVVQLSNMHYPYYVDHHGKMPFEPWTTSKAPEDNPAFFNYYLNGVHQQDEHVGSMLERVRKSPLGDHTIIVYTSDHAEAFRDHGQMGHTFSVLDEEIHVPAWIDAPPSTVSAAAQENLRAARHSFLFHPDLTATILDVLGAWDDPGIAKYRVKMLGRSLLRPLTENRPIPLTNCAGVWSCAFENWGIMDGSLKVEARAWDPEWHCYDVDGDPYEARNLHTPACSALEQLATTTFGRLPGGEKR